MPIPALIVELDDALAGIAMGWNIVKVHACDRAVDALAFGRHELSVFHRAGECLLEQRGLGNLLLCEPSGHAWIPRVSF